MYSVSLVEKLMEKTCLGLQKSYKKCKKIIDYIGKN